VAKGKVHWACQRCTACCKWPGDVIVTEEEVDSIAGFLEIPVEKFIADFTRLSANRRHLSIIDKGDSNECIMLSEGGCKIHEVKPEQCRGFPNTWNFSGWKKYCEAIPVPIKGES
jgi:Fe-S-cluster containining protein